MVFKANEENTSRNSRDIYATGHAMFDLPRMVFPRGSGDLNFSKSYELRSRC